MCWEIRCIVRIDKINRNCPGCGRPFKKDEPYPDVENCEACETFGSPKPKVKQKRHPAPDDDYDDDDD